MTVANGKIKVKVMMGLCQRVLDGRGMHVKWKTSVIVPIFKGTSDLMSFGSYRGVKLPEHATKTVEKVLLRRIRTPINLNKMHLGFMSGKGTVHATFSKKRMQEEYRKKGKKLFMYFVDMGKTIDRFPRKMMEWDMRKESLSDEMFRAVMSWYDGAKTKVKMETAYSDEFA